MIKLLVSDLDNTLLNHNKVISPYTAQVLNKCRQNGILTAFATARPEHATRNAQEVFTPDFVIANNGAEVFHHGKIIRQMLISGESSIQLLEIFLSMEQIPHLSIVKGDCLYSNYDWEQFDHEKWNSIPTDFSSLEMFSAGCIKISVECTDWDLMNDILKDYPGLHMVTSAIDPWCHIMHADTGKWTGIHYLAGHFQINAQDIIAFGDDNNDLEMLQNCGTGIAMGNAAEHVKQVADQVCLTNEADGVAKWIEKNILNNSTSL